MYNVTSFVLGVFSSITAALILNYLAGRFAYRLSFRRVLKCIMNLYRQIDDDKYQPDYVIGIDRNGSIIASILSGYLGTRAIITAHTETIRYPDGSRSVNLRNEHLPPESNFSGKKILITACFVDTGSALEVVYKYFADLSNGPEEIRTAAIFATSSPRMKPKYLVHEIGKGIKTSIGRVMHAMPWMKQGWKYVLANER